MTTTRQDVGFSIDDVCPTTTSAALRAPATLVPDNEYVVHDGKRHSFAETQRDVDRLRAALAAHGVRHGDRVGICVSNRYEWVVQFLAVTTLGAIAVPMNTRYRVEDLAYCLRHSGVALLFLETHVLTNDLLATVRAIVPEIDGALPGPAAPDLRTVVVLGTDDVPDGAVTWARFLGEVAPPVTPGCSPDDPALIQYTSGTTSRPKGVLLSHRSICGNAFVSGVRLGLRPGDRLHSARPFFHVAGSTQSVLACLQHGTTLVTMTRFEGPAALRLIEKERCTHISGNDTMVQMLLAEQQRQPRNLQLRGGWLPVSKSTLGAVIDELGARESVVAYGLSEAAPNVTLSAWWEPEEVRRTTSAPPQPGVEVQVRGPDGAVVPDGQVGEIYVRGWNVMLGYWRDHEASAAAIDDDRWLATGDLGSLVRGRLTFHGRLKDIIRVGGENVSPSEVEDVIKSHPRVRQACVVSIPDSRLVEVVCAFVEPAHGVDESTLSDEVIAWCRERVAGFKVPRHVIVVDSIQSLGVTESAKVRRQDAREVAMRQLGLVLS
ncbi:class I adenylate-forming enzyme family protein [Aeromicrobium sp. CTD01-1L150]|uniref:class I adenylate-forming enzyme family protein n=1 Tax=Aeromicrobium sp. CTD01-1L150 TaxID=3341830 RepID=UPI0035BF524B